jgi:soluble lytic murein transglycosylase-like protein
MMTSKIRTLILTLGYGVLLFAHFYVRAPKPIQVKMPTEQSIQDEIKHEQREKQYRKAAAAARMVYRKSRCPQSFSEATGAAAVDYGISARVLAALVFVESSCNPNAVSGRKSIGLTQVNPTVWKYTRTELRNPERNLKIGASILASYIHRYGLKEGLHAYNGFGNPTDEYAKKVLTTAGILIN